MAIEYIVWDEDWEIKYDTETGEYRVSYFENNHFVDSIKFKEYKNGATD